jgi:outer membrane protein TolC
MASLFLNLYKLQNSLQTVVENQKLSQSRLTDIQNMVKSGLALPNDALKIDLTLTSLDVAKAEIEQNIQVLSFNMALLTGLPTETQFTLSKDGLFTEKQSGPADQMMLKALDARPELKSAKERLRASGAGLKIARGTYFPVVSASANYYLNRPNVREFPQQDRFKNTWDLGLTFSYNITSLYNTKSQIKEARSVLSQSEIQIQQIEEQIKMDVISSQSAYELSLRKLDLARKTIIQAKENQRVLASRVKNESALISELTEADVAVAQAEINLVTTQTEIELAWIRLQKSIGI